MQRKLITLLHCQTVDGEGRTRAMRNARSIGERALAELLIKHQDSHQLRFFLSLVIVILIIINISFNGLFKSNELFRFYLKFKNMFMFIKFNAVFNLYHSSNLWAAVRARGCQFLGPAMQEEVLRY